MTTPTLIDPRPTFFSSLELGRAVLAGVRADQFDSATPCTEFNVRALTGHLVAELQRLAIIGRGGDPFDAPLVRTDVADDQWLGVWDQQVEAIDRVWRDDAVLDKMLDLSWTQLPGAITMSLFVNEVTVHTWDLAVATQQHPRFDDRVVALAMDTIQRGLAVDHRRSANADVPFDDVVDVPADAAAIDRLVAWNGRRP